MPIGITTVPVSATNNQQAVVTDSIKLGSALQLTMMNMGNGFFSFTGTITVDNIVRNIKDVNGEVIAGSGMNIAIRDYISLIDGVLVGVPDVGKLEPQKHEKDNVFNVGAISGTKWVVLRAKKIIPSDGVERPDHDKGVFELMNDAPGLESGYIAVAKLIIPNGTTQITSGMIDNTVKDFLKDLDAIADANGVVDHGNLDGLTDDDHPQYQLRSEKNEANGYAGLDNSSKLDEVQVPSLPESRITNLVSDLAAKASATSVSNLQTQVDNHEAETTSAHGGIVASTDARLTDSRAPNGTAGGDLSGTYPNPLVVDDSHDHTGATLSDISNDSISVSAAIDESKLNLNYPTHSSANDPSANQKDALAGTDGSPSVTNKFVTDSDTRNTNSRTPTAHAASHASAGSDPVTLAQSQVTDLTSDLADRALDADVVHLTGNESIAGTKTFSDDIVVSGDLTVNGSTTTVSSANLEVTDQNITVNNGGNDASAQGAGLTIERTSTNGSLAFDSSLASKFKIGLIGSESEVVTSSTTQTLTGKKTWTNGSSTASYIDGSILGLQTIDGSTYPTLDFAATSTFPNGRIQYSVGGGGTLKIGTQTGGKIKLGVAFLSDPENGTPVVIDSSSMTVPFVLNVNGGLSSSSANISFNSKNITSVGTVDGVDVSAHKHTGLDGTSKILGTDVDSTTGTNGQVLTANGSGGSTWTTATPDLSNYMTLNTDQTATGIKTFTERMYLTGSSSSIEGLRLKATGSNAPMISWSNTSDTTQYRIAQFGPSGGHLHFESTSSGLSFSFFPGGVEKFRINSASINAYTDMLSNTDNGFALGTTNNRWSTGWFGTGGVQIKTLSTEISNATRTWSLSTSSDSDQFSERHGRLRLSMNGNGNDVAFYPNGKIRTSNQLIVDRTNLGTGNAISIIGFNNRISFLTDNSNTDGTNHFISATGSNNMLVNIAGGTAPTLSFRVFDTERFRMRIHPASPFVGQFSVDGTISPFSNGGGSIGEATLRWGTVFAATVSTDGILAPSGTIGFNNNVLDNVNQINMSAAGSKIINSGTSSTTLNITGKVAINAVNAALNVPVLASDPVTLSNGDVWATDAAGVTKLNIRVGGVTKSVTFA